MDHFRLGANNGEVFSMFDLAMPPESPIEQHADCMADLELKILAWQVRSIGDSITFRNVLVWCRRDEVVSTTSDDKSPEWGLMVLTQMEGIYQHSWNILAGKSGIRRYTAAPTNDDVYRFVDDNSLVESQFFAPQTYNWNGVDVRLVAGDVREKTWEAVIGEKPTKFFLGEKE